MTTPSEYLQNIKDTVTSFWAGLAVTASHVLRRPPTVQYPDRVDVPVKDTLPPRYRGFLECDVSICTGCQACERACPIGCIAIAVEKSPADPKVRVMTRFDIDVSKCMYCGLCVEPCPTGALQHTREFESAMTHIENLTFRYIDPLKPVPVFKVTKGDAYPRTMLGELVRAQLKAWDAPAPPHVEVPKAPAKAAPAAAKPAPAAAKPAEAAPKATEAAAPKPAEAPAKPAEAAAKPAEAAAKPAEAAAEAKKP